MYRHYDGNSGRRVVVHEPERGRFQGKVLAPLPEMEKEKKAKSPPPPGNKKPHYEAPPSPLSGLSGELGKIFGKLGSLSLETEDLLLLAVLYLMYRESGDKELLIMMGALLFL